MLVQWSSGQECQVSVRRRVGRPPVHWAHRPPV